MKIEGNQKELDAMVEFQWVYFVSFSDWIEILIFIFVFRFK